MVIWLTGLSGSGKTTIANSLAAKLKESSIAPILLDGDKIRNDTNQYKFDENSRRSHNLYVGYMASLFEKNGNIVIVSLISPYDDVRKEARKMCECFIEVYISTDLETCIKRDPKGLYKKALSGEIKEFTGISSPYYPPQNPEIDLDTSKINLENCVEIIFGYIKIRQAHC